MDFAWKSMKYKLLDEIGNHFMDKVVEQPSSWPDQPSLHAPPVEDDSDPLTKVKVPCFGDQLTRVRFAGAKDLRAGNENARDRLDHIYPLRIADWHAKRSFLKLVFKKLYGNSGHQQGTLRYYREKLQRRNFTCDIKHYEDCEQLFLSVGKSFAVAAILEFFHMKSIDDSPTKHKPPFHNLHLGNNKECYFQDVLGAFVDEYIVPSKKASDSGMATPEPPAEIDHVKEYSLCLLRYYFLLSSIKDAVRTGDGDRLAILHKELLPHFKSVPGFHAYAIEMFVNILQNSVLLSEAESHTCKWASTANCKGGAGKNIEMDLLQENSNRDIKKYIKGMGANKTDKSIKRMSRASGGLRSIIDNFDDQVGKKRTSSSHSHKSATNDEKLIIEDLQKIQPFVTIPGRKHNSFHKASSDPLAALDQKIFNEWLKKHKKNMLFSIPNEEEEEDEENDEGEKWENENI